MVDINSIDWNKQYININTRIKLYGDDLYWGIEDGRESPADWIDLEAAAKLVGLCNQRENIV